MVHSNVVYTDNYDSNDPEGSLESRLPVPQQSKYVHGHEWTRSTSNCFTQCWRSL